MRADGEIDLAAVLGALVRNPHELPALMRLAVNSREAFSNLARARALLGAEFASVDLGMIASRHSAPRRIHQDSPMELGIGRRELCQAHDMA